MGRREAAWKRQSEKVSRIPLSRSCATTSSTPFAFRPSFTDDGGGGQPCLSGLPRRLIRPAANRPCLWLPASPVLILLSGLTTFASICLQHTHTGSELKRSTQPASEARGRLAKSLTMPSSDPSYRVTGGTSVDSGQNPTTWEGARERGA